MKPKPRTYKEGGAKRRVLVVTSVQAEREAVLRGLEQTEGIEAEVLVAGVGLAQAAASTAMALSAASYDWVINAGIAGGFPGKTDIGSLVLSSEIIAADLGAETGEGFCFLDQLDLGTSRIPADAEFVCWMEQALQHKGISVTTGPILTVSTVTGTQETAEELIRRVPEAAAEGMEGFGVATAARLQGVPVFEMRAVSNFVGPRNRAAWRINEALQTLEKASSALTEVVR
jgi:futalosine hydrolase